MSAKKSFVWYELVTTDSAAAAFYHDVIGWTAQDAGMATPYSIFSMSNAMIAGLMTIPPEDDNGMKPGWLGHIGVDNLDTILPQLTAAGGHIHKPAQDISGIGRFAVVADPHGAVFLLFQSIAEPSTPPAGAAEPGHIGWSELHSGDLATAWPFYEHLFGWTKGDAVDMGSLGTYQTFETGGAGGGMMTKSNETPLPVWLFYINVDSIDRAVAATAKGGGQVLRAPHQVPGGSWIANCLDPQGVLFAIVAPDR